MLGYLYSSNSKMQGDVTAQIWVIWLCWLYVALPPQSIILLVSLICFCSLSTVDFSPSTHHHCLGGPDICLRPCSCQYWQSSWVNLSTLNTSVTICMLIDTTITTQPISPLIFRLNNFITSQVFFSGYPLYIWLCFLQTRSSTLLHLYLYGLRL